MGIAENIRRIRTRSGLTQEEFGKVAGVSSMAVSQWENGRAVPRMGAVQAIADHFKITKGEIIDDESDSTRNVTSSEDQLEAVKIVRELLRNENARQEESGKSDKYTNEERHLISLFRACNKEWKHYIIQAAHIAAEQTKRGYSYSDEEELKDA